MKRRLGITVLFTMILTCWISFVEAQSSAPQTGTSAVLVGSKYNYQVADHGGTTVYLWSVSGPSSASNIANPAGSSTDITWLAQGTYTITLRETMNDGACFIEKTFTVEVKENNTELAFDEVNIAGCANEDGTPTTFDIGLTMTGGAEPWTVKYKVGTGAEQTATVNNGEKLPISNEFTNTPGAASTSVDVVINSITDKYGMPVKKYKADASVITFPFTKTLTIHQLPATTGIQHN